MPQAPARPRPSGLHRSLAQESLGSLQPAPGFWVPGLECLCLVTLHWSQGLMNAGQAQADGYPVKMGSLPWPLSLAWTLSRVTSSLPTLLM